MTPPIFRFVIKICKLNESRTKCHSMSFVKNEQNIDVSFGMFVGMCFLECLDRQLTFVTFDVKTNVTVNRKAARKKKVKLQIFPTSNMTLNVI
jgi:hypothetical protein